MIEDLASPSGVMAVFAAGAVALLIALTGAGTSTAAAAELRLPSVIADGMVL